MKKPVRLFLALLLLVPLLPLTAAANSAEPPCFTILVVDPPQELELSVQLSDAGGDRPRRHGPRTAREG